MKTVLFIVGYFIMWVVTAIILRKTEFIHSSEDAVLSGFIWPLWFPVLIIMIPITITWFIVDFVCDNKEGIEEGTEEEL